VALSYESLCPYSAQFVVNHLAKVFSNGLLDATDLTLVPYGNARVGAGGNISCQVGAPNRPSRSSPYYCTLPRARLAVLCLCVNFDRNSGFRRRVSLVLSTDSPSPAPDSSPLLWLGYRDRLPSPWFPPRSHNCELFTVLYWRVLKRLMLTWQSCRWLVCSMVGTSAF
jgi:hypothetical protein